jgi:Divergent InlB B-repeat domain/Bacterial Ig domain/Glucodextranase, domain B
MRASHFTHDYVWTFWGNTNLCQLKRDFVSQANLSRNLEHQGDIMKPLHLLAILVLGTALTACPPVTPPVLSPVVTITTPTEGQNFTTPSAKIAGTVSGAVTALSYTDNANTPRYPLTPSGNFSFNVGLNSGPNTIRVYAQNSNSAEVSSAITIYYTAPSIKYTLITSKTGQGTITSNLPGISCGTTCAFDYTSGTSVTLTATPDSGSSFASWGGACSGTNNTCTITMNQAQNVTAAFNTNLPPADTTPPTISISSPTNNSTVITDTVTVSGNAYDNLAVKSVQYSINGAPRANATGTTDWTFTTALTCGANTIVAYAKDSSNPETPSNPLTITRDCGKFSLSAVSSNIVIAQNADALYYLDLTKTAPFTTPANALTSITATGSIVGTGTNQVRVFYRADLSSATQAAIVIQAGSSVPLGAQSLVLNAVGGSVTATPILTLNFTTVVCSSGC